MQALAHGGAQLQVLGLAVTMDLVTAAGLDAAQDSDEAIRAGLFRGGEAADDVLLAPRAGGEVVDAPGGRLEGELLAGRLDPPADRQHVLAEVLEQHAGDPEEGTQPADVGQLQQGADEAEAVESAEGALNLLLVPRDKGLHGVVSGRGSLGGLWVPYPRRRHASPPWVTATPIARRASRDHPGARSRTMRPA